MGRGFQVSQDKQYNLTEGSILGKLLSVAVPIMGTQLFQMLYNLTDMFWLGRVSSDAVAASGTAGMYIWLSMGFLLIGRMGAEIGVSQNLGRKDYAGAKEYSQNSVFIALVLGILCSVTMIVFSHQLIGFFQIQETNVAQDAANYLAIVAASMPMTFIIHAFSATFTGSGNSKLPFYINGFGLTLNTILSPILIIYADMGIYGAALGTVIAQSIVFVLFLIVMKHRKFSPFEEYSFRAVFKPKKRIIQQILKWSIPISLESLCFTLLSMILARFISVYGVGAIAAQRVGSQIESLSWLIGGGFASALTTFIGQNFGAKKWDRIHQGFRMATITMTIWGIFTTFALFFGGRFLFTLFIDDPDIVALGEIYLRIFAFSQLAFCIESLAAGGFRGVGKTEPPSIVSISVNVLRVPLSYGLALTGLGLYGIWIGMSVGTFLRGVILFTWYKRFSRKNISKYELSVD